MSLAVAGPKTRDATVRKSSVRPVHGGPEHL